MKINLTRLLMSCLFLFWFSGARASSPTPSFQGFYLGANIGYLSGSTSTQVSSPNYHSTYFDPSAIAHFNQVSANALNPSSLIGGLSGGYNFASQHFLLGLEVDLNALALNNTRTIVTPANSNPIYTWNIQQKIQSDWLFTLRPRIGFISRNYFLTYATGGLAVARLSNTNNFSDNFVDPPPGHGPSYANASSQVSTTLGGWVAGLGEEILFTPKWSAKFEYLYMSFPTISGSTPLSLNPTYVNNAPQSFNYTTPVQFNIVRFGVNYHF